MSLLFSRVLTTHLTHICPFKRLLNKRKRRRKGDGGATIIRSEWVRECEGKKTSRKQVDHDRLPNNYFLITNLPTKPTYEVGRLSNHPPKTQRGLKPSSPFVFRFFALTPPPPPFSFCFEGWIGSLGGGQVAYYMRLFGTIIIRATSIIRQN